MSLRSRLITFLVFAMAVLAVSLFFLISNLTKRDYEVIETQETEEKVEQAVSVYESDIDMILNNTKDYATWDDTYFYMQGTNPDYMNVINEPVFSNLQVNIFVVIGLDGSIKTSRGYDSQSAEIKDVSAEFLDYITGSEVVREALTGQTTFSGLAVLAEGPYLIAGAPIQTSEGEGEAVGLTVLARLFDQEGVAALAATTRLDLRAYGTSSLNNEKSYRLGFWNDQDKARIVTVLDSERISGLAKLYDLSGEPSLLLEVVSGRPVHALWERTYRFFLAYSALIILAFGAVMIFAWEKYFLRRLERLTGFVLTAKNNVGKSELFPVEGNDEISHLSEGVNGLLCAQRQALDEIAAVDSSLEEKMQELSAALSDSGKKQAELEKQRLATLNILEDIHASEADLKSINNELTQRSLELATLNNLNDELGQGMDIEEAVMILHKNLSVVLNFDVATYYIGDQTDGRIIYMTFLNSEISESFVEVMKKELEDFLASGTVNMADQDRLLENIKPRIFGEKFDNSSARMPVATRCLPVGIGEKRFGAICLSSVEKEFFSPKNENLASAMAFAFSYSVERLNNLIISQHSKTASLVENLTDGVVMLNLDRNMILLNRKFTEFTALTKEDFSLERLKKLFPDLDISSQINQMFSKGSIAQINNAMLGKKFFEIFFTPVWDNFRKIAGGALVLHDITYLKEIDQMKTEFVSVASHQLRTPLTAVKLFTEMLANGDIGQLNPQQRVYLANIYQSTERMARLVNDLLNVTRIESGRLSFDPQPVELPGFVANIVKEIEPLASIKNIKLKLKNNFTDMPKIQLDMNHIRQIFNNLISNAIRYAPVKNGKVEIVLEKRDAHNVLVKVKDNGIGIPASTQQHIFQKFFRADNAIKIETEGTGLGLYVCKMLVEAYGGEIGFESEEGKGTTFYFTLPLKGIKPKQGERGLIIS